MHQISLACDFAPRQTEGKASLGSQNAPPHLTDLIFVYVCAFIYFFALMV